MATSTNVTSDKNINIDNHSQVIIFRQFCNSFTSNSAFFGHGQVMYKCDRLLEKSFQSQDIRNKYLSLWNDFASLKLLY